MSRLRISAISYLNTAPLMWDFEHGTAAGEFDISYTIPSECAAAIQTGSADIGIIPAAAYAAIPGLTILSDVAIAARKAVRSILLVSKMRVEDVQTVALDTSSLTSVALLKIIFAKWWGGGRSFSAMSPNLDRMLAEHDAALIIGDPALQVNRQKYHTYDLAEIWIRLTGKPFVFAFWAARTWAMEQRADVGVVFRQSRDHGLIPDNIHAIALTWAERLGLAPQDAEQYLTQNIYYYLDSETTAGLNLFYTYAAEIGALPPAPALRFDEVSSAIPGRG